MRRFTCGACSRTYDDRQSQVCPHVKLPIRTQSARLLAYLQSHPDATSLEITAALSICNVTGRVSDLRAAGHTIVCARRSDGRQGYRVVEAPVQMGMAL